MINPFVDNLADFTVTELEDKVTDLQRKYFMTHNPQVQAQISNVLEIYKQEVQTRRAQEYHRQTIQNDGENGLDNLININ